MNGPDSPAATAAGPRAAPAVEPVAEPGPAPDVPGVPGTPHRIVNPETLLPSIGYSHAVVAVTGRTVYLGGQTGHGANGELIGESVVEQFEVAAANVETALAAAGARPVDMVSMQILTTAPREYRDSLAELGRVWREHFGSHYPAITWFGVTELFDEGCKVELTVVAVVPEA